MDKDPALWPNTRITALLKTQLPLIQAPMSGGASTPELIAAVSNAGGLGSLGAGYLTAEEIKAAIKKIRLLTTRPFSVNLFIPEQHSATEEEIELARQTVQSACPELNFEIGSVKPPYAPLFEDQIKVILDERVPVFSFVFGVLSDNWIELLKKNGIVAIGTATSLEEARLLEKLKIDAIVAQGSEAGGHRGTFLGKAEEALTPTSTLVSILKKTIKTPIIAAGGIMDAKGIVAALNSGSAAVQLGTAFLSCPESGIHSAYKKLLLNTRKDLTTLTRAFSGKLARGLNNKFIARMQEYQKDILHYPIQNSLTSPMRREAARQGNTDFMSLWASQAAHLCQALPAAQLIEDLKAEVEKLLTEEQKTT